MSFLLMIEYCDQENQGKMISKYSKFQSANQHITIFVFDILPVLTKYTKKLRYIGPTNDVGRLSLKLTIFQNHELFV